MPSRETKDCHPLLQPLLEQFKAQAKAKGLPVLITCTYRSKEEQAKLYAQGRTAPGAVVTWVKPGGSRHNDTLAGKPAATAFDFVPLLNGKPDWNDKNPAWQRLGEIAESLGLEWGGRWKKRDMPHVQLKTRPA